MSGPQKYRKKPVVIEAERYSGNASFEGGKGGPFGALCILADIPLETGVPMHIHTLEGWHIVTAGDYIIRGVKGEFYPCKPDIFAATYEQVLDGVAEGLPVPHMRRDGSSFTEIEVDLDAPDAFEKMRALADPDFVSDDEIRAVIADRVTPTRTLTVKRWKTLPQKDPA